MIITTVHMNEDGGYIINKNATASDEGELTISGDAAGNRHYTMVQEWIDDGNTPTPYVAPEPHWIDKRLASVADGGYGTIGQQLEMIGEQGMDVFQAHIAKVKSDIPKENK